MVKEGEETCGAFQGTHLISLWTVCLLQWQQNFFTSSRSDVLRRFFWDV